MRKQRKRETVVRTPGELVFEVERAVRGATDHQISDTHARAQELALDALSVGSTSKQLELAVKSIILDPRSTDALVILADIFEEIDDYVEAMYLIVMRATEDLGAEIFHRERGRFWEVVEARPYMRARKQLALGLQEAGMNPQAIAEFEGMIDLNTSDNLGARFPLLVLYLQTGKLDLATSLLARFAGDPNTQFTWLRILAALLEHDPSTAEAELQRARDMNKHVEGFLTGRKHLPEKLPAKFTNGDVSEAIACTLEIQNAWAAHPDAMVWLKEHERPREKKGKR